MHDVVQSGLHVVQSGLHVVQSGLHDVVQSGLHDVVQSGLHDVVQSELHDPVCGISVCADDFVDLHEGCTAMVASFPVPRPAFRRLQYGKVGRAWSYSLSARRGTWTRRSTWARDRLDGEIGSTHLPCCYLPGKRSVEHP